MTDDQQRPGLAALREWEARAREAVFKHARFKDDGQHGLATVSRFTAEINELRAAVEARVRAEVEAGGGR